MGLLNKISGKYKGSEEKADSKKKVKKPALSQESEKKNKTAEITNVSKDAYRVLVRPVISEKSATQSANKKFSFIVSSRATKIDVARAFRGLYGVKPTHVRVLNVEGKKVQFGRARGQRRNFKKAIVTVPKDSSVTIDYGA